MTALKNPKAKGSRNERKSRDLLLGKVDQTQSCLHVIKAGGSLGCFDLVGLGRDIIYLVQVKSNKWPGKAEMDRIREAVGKLDPKVYRVELHRWDDYVREPYIRLVTNENGSMGSGDNRS